ncbi:hypothetical protein ES703_61325 [subsurface metagenome]
MIVSRLIVHADKVIRDPHSAQLCCLVKKALSSLNLSYLEVAQPQGELHLWLKINVTSICWDILIQDLFQKRERHLETPEVIGTLSGTILYLGGKTAGGGLSYKTVVESVGLLIILLSKQTLRSLIVVHELVCEEPTDNDEDREEGY